MIIKRVILPVIFLSVLTGVLLAGCFSSNKPIPSVPKSPWIRDAVFAPDGKTIFLTFKSNNISGLFAMDLSGKVTTWLVEGRPGARIYEPTVSPDGRYVALVMSGRDHFGDLYLIDAKGGALRRLTSGSNHDRSPRFSRDGKRIYFLRHDSGGEFPAYDAPGGWDSDVFSLTLATGETSRITHQNFHHLRQLFVFPHDRFFLINTPDFWKTGYVLWRISLRDPNQRQPVEPNMSAFTRSPNTRFHDGDVLSAYWGVVLSRNGHYLVFAWHVPKEGEAALWAYSRLYFCSLGDMKGHRVPGLQTGSIPLDISPDNQWVLFSGPSGHQPMAGGVLPQTNLYMIRRDGSGLKNFSLDFSAVLGREPVNSKLP
ncbi:MAG: hypothetical protein KQH53_19140 [Desulfarculaceae bacterium]|nr:hypothetical protein [Desulfarculaceae bacterium]